MSQLANVVIVMSRCARSKQPFGIRFEEKGRGQWLADWAFTVQERLAKKEGYDRADIKGAIMMDADYPGCPYCHNEGIIHCARCDKVSCYDHNSSVASCAWCGASGQVGGEGIGGLKGGSDLL